MDAIRLFAPHITEFFFVDWSYFQRKPADQVKPILQHKPAYQLIDVEFSEGPLSAITEWRIDPDTGRSYRWIEPCRRSERYIHVPSSQEIVIHRRRGSGASGLKKLIQQLGIFYYRGDSSEGSNLLWLRVNTRKHKRGKRFLFDEVLDRIVDNGLIVTDGSNCPYGEYHEFARFHATHDEISGEEAMRSATSFTDCRGFSYRCVGYAGHRYGPTLIWQVSRPD
ncbi:MAG: hypothetical protein L0154_07485 [Chloroflexi bacterium]|nr:hypothetical protein [Chloroflexota bacterium]